MRILYSSHEKFVSLAKQFRHIANTELNKMDAIGATEAREAFAAISGYRSEYELKKELVDSGAATVLSQINLAEHPEFSERLHKAGINLDLTKAYSVLRRVFGEITHRLMVGPSRMVSILANGYLREHGTRLPGELNGGVPITDKHVIHFIVGDIDSIWSLNPHATGA